MSPSARTGVRRLVSNATVAGAVDDAPVVQVVAAFRQQQQLNTSTTAV